MREGEEREKKRERERERENYSVKTLSYALSYDIFLLTMMNVYLVQNGILFCKFVFANSFLQIDFIQMSITL